MIRTPTGCSITKGGCIRSGLSFAAASPKWLLLRLELLGIWGLTSSTSIAVVRLIKLLKMEADRACSRLPISLSNIIAAVKVPVTVKIRTGWDDKSINAVEITRIAERAGAKAITIHGRTREQGYKGKANWDHIKACKEAARDILVIGNGDVFDAESALRMFAHTKCDAVLVSRGTMGQPWIAQDILRALDGLDPLPRSVGDLRDSLLEHFDCIVRYQPEKQSLLDMRRVGCWYLKRLVGVKELRVLLNRSSSTSEVFQHLNQFSWESAVMNQEPVFAESEC